MSNTTPTLDYILKRLDGIQFGEVKITKYRGEIASAVFTEEERFLNKKELKALREKDREDNG